METLGNVLGFKYLKKLRTSINEPQSSGPRILVMIGFKFKHFRELQVLTNLNHLVQGLMHDWI